MVWSASCALRQAPSDRPRIICTQPRKVAALSLAKRVAFEWAAGAEEAANGLGNAVGYHVGGVMPCESHTGSEVAL